MLKHEIFHPLQLKPELFFDARELAGGIADGGGIATWPNLGVGTPDFVQAVGAAQPTFRLSGYNGQPCVETDGVDDVMALSGDTGAATLEDPCLIVIYDPTNQIRVGDTTADSRCYYWHNQTCGYGDASANVPTASPRGIGIVTGGHGRVLNGGTDAGNLKGTHATGVFHAVTSIDATHQGGKIMCVIGFLRSPSSQELNAIIMWANDIWGLNVPANIQPWTPSLLDPEAEWDCMTLPEAVGASVASLPDKTGNGHDAVQATRSKQPVVALYNGRKGLKFDGVDDFYDLASAITLGVDDWTMIALLADVQESAVVQEILCKSSNEQFRLETTKAPRPYFVDDSANARLVSGDAISAGGDSIVILTIDYSAENELYQNGVSKATDNTVYTDNLDGLEYIGAIDGTDRFLMSTLCYLSVIKRVLVDGERKRLERFLALRSGITL